MALAYVVSVGTTPTLLVDSSPGGAIQWVAAGSIVRCMGAEIRWGGPTVTWADGMPLLATEALEWDQQANVDLYAVVSAGTADVNVAIRSGERGNA